MRSVTNTTRREGGKNKTERCKKSSKGLEMEEKRRKKEERSLLVPEDSSQI